MKVRFWLLTAVLVGLAACGRTDLGTSSIPLPTSVLSVPTAAPIPTAEATAALEPNPSAVTGDLIAGEALFTSSHETAQGVWACTQCHSITPDEARLIGPGLWNVARHAETRVPGQSAHDYLRASILHPNEFIVPAEPPYPQSLMPQNYADVFSEKDVEDLIAYLMTLQAQ